MPNKEIIKKLKSQKKALMEKYSIKTIGIFGSYARGEEKPESDVDILIEFSEIPGLFRYMEIEEAIENILSKKVDLVEKYSIKKGLEKYILDEVIQI